VLLERLKLIFELAKKTFIKSHGHSADRNEIFTYVNENYSEDLIKNELKEDYLLLSRFVIKILL
jgi:hypothetical protein